MHENLVRQLTERAQRLAGLFVSAHHPYNCTVEFSFTTVRFLRRSTECSASEEGWGLGLLRADLAIAITHSGEVIYNGTGIQDSVFGDGRRFSTLIRDDINDVLQHALLLLEHCERELVPV